MTPEMLLFLPVALRLWELRLLGQMNTPLAGHLAEHASRLFLRLSESEQAWWRQSPWKEQANPKSP